MVRGGRGGQMEANCRRGALRVPELALRRTQARPTDTDPAMGIAGAVARTAPGTLVTALLQCLRRGRTAIPALR